jgi:hypothetical protein
MSSDIKNKEETKILIILTRLAAVKKEFLLDFA